MTIKRIKDFPDGSGALSNDDIILFMDDPNSDGITKKISLSQLSAIIGGGGGTSFAIENINLHNGGLQNAQVLKFDDDSYQSVITGPTPTSGNSSQRIIVQGQRAQGNGEGGDVYLWGGDSDRNGGDIKIYAGDADNVSPNDGYGGYVNIDGGRGITNGGNIEITAGYSDGGQAGDIVVAGGSTSSGVAGIVSVQTNNNINNWIFDLNGNLNIPGNITLPNYTTVATGTYDNGIGGNGGISLNCAVGYELNWQGGHLKSTLNNGETTYNILCDSAIEFPGVGTSNMEIGAKGLTFPDGNIQVTSSDPMTKGPQQNPRGMARIVTVNSGVFTAYIKSTTGYIAVRLWDGSVQIFGDGQANVTQYIPLSIPESGSWSGSSPKEIFIWSCTEGSSIQSGDLTWINVNSQSVTGLEVSGLTALFNLYCADNLLTSLNLSGLTALNRLECNNNFLTALDISGLTALDTVFCYNNSIITRLNAKGATSLTHLRCQNNSITSLELSGTALEILLTHDNSLVELDVSELTALNQLSCNNNSLSSLNVSGLTSLGDLNCSNNSLTILNVSGLTGLGGLNCSNNSLTTLSISGLTSLMNLNCSNNSIVSINISGATSLSSLNCTNNSIVSLDVSELTALTTLYCSDNSLTSLRAIGIGLGGSSGYTYGLVYGGDISDNSLSAGALNQFYSDLASSAGFLNVAGNPGISSDDPTIATAKGYTVYGS